MGLQSNAGQVFYSLLFTQEQHRSSSLLSLAVLEALQTEYSAFVSHPWSSRRLLYRSRYRPWERHGAAIPLTYLAPGATQTQYSAVCSCPLEQLKTAPPLTFSFFGAARSRYSALAFDLGSSTELLFHLHFSLSEQPRIDIWRDYS